MESSFWENLSPNGQKERILAINTCKDKALQTEYTISKDWYKAWKLYVEASQGTPGPVYMDNDDPENNMFVREEAWLSFVRWYGVAKSHRMNRRRIFRNGKALRVALKVNALAPHFPTGLCYNFAEIPAKYFYIPDNTGYIEFQMRRMFHIESEKHTRLLVSEIKSHFLTTEAEEDTAIRPSASRLLGQCFVLQNRESNICFNDKGNISFGHDSYGKAVKEPSPCPNTQMILEVSVAPGVWMSGLPGEPVGDMMAYNRLLTGPTCSHRESVSGEVHSLQNIFGTLSCQMKTTLSELRKERHLLQDKIKNNKLLHEELEKKAKDLSKRDELLLEMKMKLEEEEKRLDREREKYELEVKQLEDVNKIQESKITLDVGGNRYTTSVMTLTKEAGSMLSIMFSGRYPLKKESDGSFFIDRDGTYFGYILNYLRDGTLNGDTLPDDEVVKSRLLVEANYYQLAGLIHILEQMID